MTSLRQIEVRSVAKVKDKLQKLVKASGKDDKKNTSLRLDNKTLKALKIRAIESDSSVQKIIEVLIHDYLNAPGKSK